MFNLARKGESARQIAEALGLTTNTAKTYLVMAKSRAAGALGEEALTNRERDVRDLMLRRLTDAEIAASLGLSVRTVEQHAREVRRKLGMRTRRSLSNLPGVFTDRERDVGRLLAQGLSDKEIAERLGISNRTAETHARHVLRKTGFQNRIQLLRVAELLGSGVRRSRR